MGIHFRNGMEKALFRELPEIIHGMDLAEIGPRKE